MRNDNGLTTAFIASKIPNVYQTLVPINGVRVPSTKHRLHMNTARGRNI